MMCRWSGDSADRLLRRRLVVLRLLEWREQLRAVGADDRVVVRRDLGVERHTAAVAGVAEQGEAIDVEELAGVLAGDAPVLAVERGQDLRRWLGEPRRCEG